MEETEEFTRRGFSVTANFQGTVKKSEAAEEKNVCSCYDVSENRKSFPED